MDHEKRPIIDLIVALVAMVALVVLIVAYLITGSFPVDQNVVGTVAAIVVGASGRHKMEIKKWTGNLEALREALHATPPGEVETPDGD